MRPEILETIEMVFQQQQQDRRIGQLSEALIYALRIPPDRSLILWLTDQPARTNREAVGYWVRLQLRRLDGGHNDDVLPQLRRELQLHLMSIQEGS